MKNKKATDSILSLAARIALITRLTDHVVAECTAIDIEARYDSFLDEVYADMLKGPFEFLRPSAVMKEMCPTDYRCGVADMTGTDDTLREIGGEYYNEEDVEEAREKFIAELEERETALEADIDAALEPEVGSAGTLEEQLATVRAEIEMCENHSF